MNKVDQLILDAEKSCDWFREQGERFKAIEDEMTGDVPEDVGSQIDWKKRCLATEEKLWSRERKLALLESDLRRTGELLRSTLETKKKPSTEASFWAAVNVAERENKLKEELQKVKELLQQALESKKKLEQEKSLDRYSLFGRIDNRPEAERI